LKRTRPQDVGEKENFVPYKKFNVVGQGHGSQPGGKKKKCEGKGQLQCWICGKEHFRKDFTSHHGGSPEIYNDQEVQTIGDVGQSIPWMYATLDNRQLDQYASIIEMYGKLCDQVVYIFIDLRSNYSYVNPDMVDKCGLRKEMHAKYWLV